MSEGVSTPFADYLTQRNAMLQQLVAEARGWKIARYFHDCLPGCRPGSDDPADHVPVKPDQGPTCRVLYRKAVRWLAAGATYPERGFIAANRIGKTDTAAYEVVCHLTGHYPAWWRGKRWTRPTDWRVAGDTMLTTRDILQRPCSGRTKGSRSASGAGCCRRGWWSMSPGAAAASRTAWTRFMCATPRAGCRG